MPDPNVQVPSVILPACSVLEDPIAKRLAEEADQDLPPYADVE